MKLSSLRLTICAASLGALLITGACSNDMQSEMKKQTDAAEQQVDKLESHVDDAAITTAVKSKLAADVRLSTITEVSVETENGVVTLDGVVENEAIKNAAEEVAETVDGVMRVSNRLRVEPASKG